MHRYLAKIAIISSCLFLSYSSHGQWAFSELNVAHQYDENAEVSLKAQVTVKDDSIVILAALKLNLKDVTKDDYNFEVYTPLDLNQKLTQPTSIDTSWLGSTSDHQLYKITTAYNNRKWVILRVISIKSGFSFYHEYPISITHNADFVIKNRDLPVVSSYLKPGSYQANSTLSAFYYSYGFDHALPPMITRAPLPSKGFNVDSTFRIEANVPFKLQKSGLYYFQEDTSKMIGRGATVYHKYFPELAKLSHLIEPLVYITTKAEKERLDEIETKKEFDQFWLDLTQSPQRAKKIIKEFYDRVEYANEIFTTFKEGWKTDRGMIYIIFGTPDELLKTDTEEVWVYAGNNRQQRIKFRFLKTDNIFSSSHYTLIRDKKYDSVWFRAVDAWRKSRF
ncbi:GWxTD domain-containing protein [Fulvivirga sp. RKSG066]|uniref:GWxTD domain-containing protein n=1 Tax=Fulvivirga aurantia TaxID=2529383 RepID=UPI0012BB95B4|nr:GWxTD domain-containing protein [Fulvivirga aurantia]MTI22178.1 GWxTD domain-containing protein [Fulvivirga aurantia]